MVTAIFVLVQDVVPQLFRAATLNLQGGLRPVLYDVVEHINHDHIWTPLLREAVNKPVGGYFEVGKAPKPYEKDAL